MLVVAIKVSKPIIAETLIRNFGTDVNVCYGNKGNSALHLACLKANEKYDRYKGVVREQKQKDREDIVDLLLKHGANYNALNEKMETPIAYTTQN